VAVALALVAWNNVIVPRLPGDRGYLAGNVIASAALLTAARAAGLSWEQLGLERRRVRAGARWGGACVVLVAAGYAVAVAVPDVRPLLADERAAGRDATAVAYAAMVRIPLGTVLWEEVAFRGVLLAALGRVLSPRAAVAASAVVFGLWHVRPAFDAVTANDLADGPVLTGLAVLLGCSFTALAGVLFVWLRLRSGSLLAPALLHLATNSLGTVAAAAAHRLS
jgi:membrane protease YdiL (CAAX protease family)